MQEPCPPFQMVSAYAEGMFESLLQTTKQAPYNQADTWNLVNKNDKEKFIVIVQNLDGFTGNCICLVSGLI